MISTCDNGFEHWFHDYRIHFLNLVAALKKPGYCIDSKKHFKTDIQRILWYNYIVSFFIVFIYLY